MAKTGSSDSFTLKCEHFQVELIDNDMLYKGHLRKSC